MTQTSASAKTLTNAVLELHADDAALVSLVLPGVVPKLRDPALGRPVRRARVHQPIDQQQADHRVRVSVHHLTRHTVRAG